MSLHARPSSSIVVVWLAASQFANVAESPSSIANEETIFLVCHRRLYDIDFWNVQWMILKVSDYWRRITREAFCETSQMSLNVCTRHPVLYFQVQSVSMTEIAFQIRICTTDTRRQSQCKVAAVTQKERELMSRFQEYEEKHRGYADRSGSTPRPYSIVLNQKRNILLQIPIDF